MNVFVTTQKLVLKIEKLTCSRSNLKFSLKLHPIRMHDSVRDAISPGRRCSIKAIRHKGDLAFIAV